MNSDQIDAYASRLPFQAVERVGAEEAPGTLLQALILVMLDHHSFEAAIYSLDQTVCQMRERLVMGRVP